MSFIFDTLGVSSETKKSIGYFDTKVSEFQEIDSSENFVYNFSGSKSVYKNTVVIYYSGAFTVFHEGHYNLMCKAYNDLKQKYKDIRIVISPANSDYIYEKYGPEYDVGNTVRFNRIVDFISSKSSIPLEDIIIDMNPMLNMVCDFNFTDLVKNYIEKYINYFSLTNTPFLLCGKDKSHFKKLETYTEALNVYYAKGCETSSSNKLEVMPKFKKKHIILRVHTKEEFKIFKKYLKPYYESITPYLISDEVKHVINLINIYTKNGKYNNIYTNCRDYRDYETNIAYIRIKRKFEHPLDTNPTIEAPELKSGDLYIDSDSFSGKTKEYIESFGNGFACIYDFRLKQDTHDIVDIDDLYKSDFSYPEYDLSERMGLPLFNTEMHKIIKSLKSSLLFSQNKLET